MGIRTADYIDIDDMDVLHGEGLLPLLQFSFMEDDGTYSKENQQLIDDYQRQSEEYNRLRTELYAESYENLSLWLYQTDKRGMFTEEEFLNKFRELKTQTIEKREALSKACFPKVEGTEEEE